jgi:hypothetical protein
LLWISRSYDNRSIYIAWNTRTKLCWLLRLSWLWCGKALILDEERRSREVPARESLLRGEALGMGVLLLSWKVSLSGDWK